MSRRRAASRRERQWVPDLLALVAPGRQQDVRYLSAQMLRDLERQDAVDAVAQLAWVAGCILAKSEPADRAALLAQLRDPARALADAQQRTGLVR